MFSDKVFQVAFIVSLITHGIILFQNPKLNLNVFSINKNERELEVSYVKSLPETKEYLKKSTPDKELFLKSSPKITAAKASPPPFIENEDIFKKTKEIISPQYNFTKPAFIKPDVIAVKKKITLPPIPIDVDKINNPSYISYYQIVREKIRRAAYQNYSRTEIGKVELSFVILSSGFLEKIQLAEEKSSSSPYLKEIALKSIKEASPFPNFPKELDYPQLSFNVVISFEVE